MAQDHKVLMSWAISQAKISKKLQKRLSYKSHKNM